VAEPRDGPAPQSHDDDEDDGPSPEDVARLLDEIARREAGKE
jgi:hypothetical protein